MQIYIIILYGNYNKLLLLISNNNNNKYLKNWTKDFTEKHSKAYTVARKIQEASLLQMVMLGLSEL